MGRKGNYDLTDEQIELCNRFGIKREYFRRLLGQIARVKHSFERQKEVEIQLRFQEVAENTINAFFRFELGSEPMKVYTVKVGWDSFRPTVTLVDGPKERILDGRLLLPPW